MTNENLHLKNNSKLTTMNVSNENENQSLMNLLNVQWLTCNWNTTLLPGKKAPNPHCFCFE